MADKDVITLVAVGDVGPKLGPKRPHPEEAFDHTRSILKGADITIGQLEENLSTRGTPQLGLPLSIDHPKMGKVIADAGFDVMSFATNHTLDYSEDAMLDTIDVMRQNNIPILGVGKNIDEARKPVILERKGTKVGFLAYCSVVPRGCEAGLNKSGVAPLRASSSYEQVDWQPGTPARIFSKANPTDLAAMLEDIAMLRPKVDVLVIYMHWGVHVVPAIIADYQYEIGHAAIDAGADIIIGTHAHILKGIEVYKGRVIFFSLCNFVLDFNPEDQVAMRRVSGGRSHNIPKPSPLFKLDIDPDSAYDFSIDAQKTMLVKCTIIDKRIQRVAYLPLWMNRKGEPEPVSHSDPRYMEHLKYMEWLCVDQKLETKLSPDGDEVVILT